MEGLSLESHGGIQNKLIRSLSVTHSFNRKTVNIVRVSFLSIAVCAFLVGQDIAQDSVSGSNYKKTEYRIPMRDGVKLFTSVYVPVDGSQTYPILMTRTPYGVAPYGPASYLARAPSPFTTEGYIFVLQDVRGRFMSEGEFKWMTPYIDKKQKAGDVDESTDTYDTIEWLLKNVPNNNGRVGMYGISYPGFYTAAALVNPHPALQAASPQAPTANNYLADP